MEQRKVVNGQTLQIPIRFFLGAAWSGSAMLADVSASRYSRKICVLHSATVDELCLSGSDIPRGAVHSWYARRRFQINRLGNQNPSHIAIAAAVIKSMSDGRSGRPRPNCSARPAVPGSAKFAQMSASQYL